LQSAPIGATRQKGEAAEAVMPAVERVAMVIGAEQANFRLQLQATDL
jgi:hypothetical protein